MIRHHTVTGVFSVAECADLVALAERAPAAQGRLVGNVGSDMRRADLVWVDDLPGCDWVMDRLTRAVAEANRATFGFDIEGFDESAQIARYGAERRGHFDWHSDIGDGRLAARRKLTIVAQLSDPADYAGGALELQPSAHVVQADRARGAVTLFPSYLLHRVTPVTEGVRFSLTLWSHGPAFR